MDETESFLIGMGFLLSIALPILLAFFLIHVRNMDVIIAGPIAFGLTGAGLIALGVYLQWDVLTFEKWAVPAEGTVVRMKTSHNKGSQGKTTTIYAPVVQFRTPEGQVVEFTGLGSSPPEHKQGDKLPVLYLPFSPQKARIRSFRQMELAPSLFLGTGALFSSIALFSVYFFREPKTPQWR
jgi:hypothetical protein